MRFTKDSAMRPRLVAATAAAALLLAACGGSSTSSSHVAAATSQPTTPTAPTSPGGAPSTASRTSATGATTSLPSSGPPPCRASDLALSFLGGQGATGHGELGFALRNTSAESCATVGYPGVQFLDRAGRPLPTIPSHTTQDFFGTAPKLALTVVPGSTVSFRLGVTHGVTSTAGCTTAYGLQVIPPNDTASLRTAIANGAYECQTTTVSPLQKGTSAYL